MNPFLVDVILSSGGTAAALYLATSASQKSGRKGKNLIQSMRQTPLLLGVLLAAQAGHASWAAGYTGSWSILATMMGVLLVTCSGWAKGYRSYRYTWRQVEADIKELFQPRA